MKNTLKLLVTEAVVVDRNLHLLAQRLHRLKKQIITIASQRADLHQPTGGGGASWSSEGFDGCIARVSFPGHALLSSVDPETPDGKQLLEKLGTFRLELLRPVLHYQPIPDFRDRVRTLFDHSKSEEIIASCQAPSPPRVSFATKQSARRSDLGRSAVPPAPAETFHNSATPTYETAH